MIMSPNCINKGQLREWLGQAVTNKLPGIWLDGSHQNIMRLANSLHDSRCWLRGPHGSLIGTVDDRWPSSSAKWVIEPSLPPRPQCGTIHALSAPAVCLHGAAQTPYAHYCSRFVFELICLPFSDIRLSSDRFFYITILYSTPSPPYDFLPLLWITSATYLMFLCCFHELLNTLTKLIFVFSVVVISKWTHNCNVPHSNTFETVTYSGVKKWLPPSWFPFFFFFLHVATLQCFTSSN